MALSSHTSMLHTWNKSWLDKQTGSCYIQVIAPGGSLVKHTIAKMIKQAYVDYDDHCTVVIVIEYASNAHSED